MQVRLRRTIQHPEYRRFGANREQHKNGQHAPRANVVAVDEPQSIRDGVPHAVDGAARTSKRREPFRERDIIQVADLRA